MICAINKADVPVLSIDIPSGVNAADGTFVTAIKAELTYAMSCLKIGHLLFPGAEYCGKITVLECGIPMPQSSDAQSLCLPDLKTLPNRARRSNKASFGRIALVAGSKGMAGACFFAAKAALLSGAGLVEIFCPEENRIILQTLLPEAVLHIYNDDTSPEELVTYVKRCDAMVLGPGLGTGRQSAQLVKVLLSTVDLPAIVDADGLNLCVGTTLLENYKGRLIITPHPGEGARLLECTVKAILDDPLAAARALADRCNATVLLKDAHTIICTDDLLSINLSGNDGMATAGSGDLLTGIIATLVAQGFSSHDGAAMAAYIHGLAGDFGAKKHGKRSLTASRIADHIEEVLKVADQPTLINSIEEM